MGMDISAVNPTDADNDYFRANCWSWRPIHMFMSESCADVYGEDIDNSMHFNDGAGIPGDLVEECADKMQAMLDNIEKEVPQYISTYTYEDGETLKVLKPVEDPKWKDAYMVPLNRLQSWVHFVRNSGGFKVW